MKEKNRLNNIFFLLVYLSFFPSQISLGQERAIRPHNPFTKKVALVIGNANYSWIEALNNPGNDAIAMKQSLEKIGFDVQLRLDGTKDEIVRDLNKFGDRITDKNTIGLFFYAGHGVQIENQNYLIPVDATLEADSLPNFELVSLSILMRELKRADNIANIIILDACRNNPYNQLSSSNSKGLAEMNYPKRNDLLIAYATSPGEVALDGIGPNSEFTRSLHQRIKEPGNKIEDVFKLVMNDVKNTTNDQQRPWITFSLTKDICFVTCPEKGKVISPITNPKYKPEQKPTPEPKVETHYIPTFSSPGTTFKIDESSFRLFVEYAMPGLMITKESITMRNRLGVPERDRESYNGSGMGLSLFYFLNYDFSVIYQSVSADLHQVSFTTDAGKSSEQQGTGTIDFRSISLAYNWGGERDSWIGKWWVIYLGFGFGYCAANFEAENGANYTVTTIGGHSIFGFDYRTEDDWLFGSSFRWAMNGSPSGTRVQELEDQGYDVRVSSSLTALSIGYQFY